MNNAFNINSNFLKIKKSSSIFLLQKEESLKARGCGRGFGDYVDYDWIQGEMQGFIDEIVITPSGSSWGQDDWEDSYINDQIGNDYPDYSENTGGSSVSYAHHSHHTTSHSDHTTSHSDHATSHSEYTTSDIEHGENFYEKVLNGDVSIIPSSEIVTAIDGLELPYIISEMLPDKIDTGIYGKFGAVLSKVTCGINAVSVVLSLTDGEISPRDIVNAASTVCSIGSFFCPGIGLISYALSIASFAVPGDKAHHSGNRGY